MEMPLHMVLEKEREVKAKERKRVENIIAEHIADVTLKNKIINEIKKDDKNDWGERDISICVKW